MATLPRVVVFDGFPSTATGRTMKVQRQKQLLDAMEPDNN